MNMKSGSLDYWRKYFGTAKSDIFTIIDHAIMVAALDCPQQFKRMRDGIAERLFSSGLTKCLGCERVEVAVSGNNDEEVDDHGGCKRGFKKDGFALEAGASKGSNVNSIRARDDDHNDEEVDDHGGCKRGFKKDGFALEAGASKGSNVNNIIARDDDHGEMMDVNHLSNHSLGEAEALTDEIEQESQEVAVSGNDDEEVDDHGGCKRGFKKDGFALEAGASKGSNVNSIRARDDDHGEMMDVNHLSNHSLGEAEALTDEIEQESQDVGEILRIKNIMLNYKEESDSVLFESLRRLQLMQLTLDRLQATKIGKAVKPLRKHGSKDISQLARTLIGCWTEIVDEWFKASTTASEGTPEGAQDSVNPAVLDEGGLPSPPMDEWALFVAQNGSIELSAFFDGMDVIQDSVNPSVLDEGGLPSPPMDEGALFVAQTGSIELSEVCKMEPKMQKKLENNTIPKKPPLIPKDKFKFSDEAAVQVKLEASKRKLQESYQQAENAKRQRTIKVVDIKDLPKPLPGQRNSRLKPDLPKPEGSQR